MVCSSHLSEKIECWIRERKKNTWSNRIPRSMLLGSNVQAPAMLHLCLWVVASMWISNHIKSILFQLQKPTLFYPSQFRNLRSKPLGKERKVSRHQVVQDNSRLDQDPFLINDNRKDRIWRQNCIEFASSAEAIALQMSVFTVICCRKTSLPMTMTVLNSHHSTVGYRRTGCLKMCKDNFHIIPP